MTSISSLKKIFKDKNLLERALTHRSWVNENPGVRGTNERLEFLGDAILEYVVSEELYKQFPDKEEGYLTALRANLVNTTNLSRVAEKLKVGEAIYLSRGEEDGGGRTNPSLLADTTEAVIGALYLDQGTKVIREFIQKNLLSDIPQKIQEPLKDAKSRFQEFVQAKGLATPKYKVIGETGPDHAKAFLVEAVVDGKVFAKGKGKSKSEASRDAAEKALKTLVKKGPSR